MLTYIRRLLLMALVRIVIGVLMVYFGVMAWFWLDRFRIDPFRPVERLFR